MGVDVGYRKTGKKTTGGCQFGWLKKSMAENHHGRKIKELPRKKAQKKGITVVRHDKGKETSGLVRT